MPELRKDPVVGRWVIIATERAKRPQDFSKEDSNIDDSACPFCEGKEALTPHEIFSLRSQGNTPGWDVRVVPSINPLLVIEGKLNRRPKGMYDLMDAIGAHEIVVETPKHIHNMADLEESQIVKVFDVYLNRLSDLEKDHRFKYVLIFKNYGVAAGAGPIKHSRSQLIATPVNPKRVKEELMGSRRYFEYKERCVFCDIIRQEIADESRVVLESEEFVVIAPFASRFPFELNILPKKHSADFTKISHSEKLDLARVLKNTLMKLKIALNDPPYNFVLHSAPFRGSRKQGYWKTVDSDYHWHIEIMPRLTSVAGFEWGSGVYINPTPPEEAAKYLKELGI